MRLRVAPPPASSSSAWSASPGCPVLRTLVPRRRRSFGLPRIFSPLAVPAMEFRVTPNLAFFRAAECLKLRVAPTLHVSCCACDESPGSPRSCISGFAGDGASSCPASRILRRCRLTNSPGCPGSLALRYRRRSVFGLPRTLDLPAPADGSPSCPGSRTIRLCHRRTSGLPRSFFSGDAD